ncbi:Hypothetical protein SRAE_X000248100 [Strongyloides ratti]|uniref:Uncharacterized protein n=1 Tax=Strongyloides ratti TaxID=34506 RepID=A0A090KTH3_STRRB|nr:Hypothetical protein SRAE_X000248100 [Strongyloides ratti]CEF60805.1 Hypothetical protein SRAE_X000248100 [Strongyloides ratti]
MTSLSEYVSEQRGKNQSGIGLITNSFKSIGIGQRLTGVLSNWNGNRVNDDNLNEPLIDENNENNDTSSSWFNLSNRKNSNDNGNDCFGLGYLQRDFLFQF